MADTAQGKQNVTIVEPVAGLFKLGITEADIARVDVVDVDFVLFLKKGTRIVLVNAAMDAMSDHPPDVAFSDGAKISLAKLMVEVGNININEVSPSMSSVQPEEKKEPENQEQNQDQQQGLAPTHAEPVNVIPKLI